jgi:DNA polymerase-3 subunit alpha
MVESFVERKHGRQSIVYSHPLAEPILRETYGMILYQEQVQKIASVMASYSLGEADLLRRAMGKKIPEEMAKQRDRFVKGAVDNAIAQEVAEEIFDLMAEFANYGFNKSHSAAYGLLSYQTAYLKTHYPEEFFAASMTCDMDNTDKLVRYFEDCQRLGIKVLPPDCASSGLEFTVRCKGEITFALSAIKGIGGGVVKELLAARKEGPFRTLSDLARRINLSMLGKKTLQLLSGAGALDAFGLGRKRLDQLLPELINFSSHHHTAAAMGQPDLFSLDADDDEDGAAAQASEGAWEEECRSLQGEVLAGLDDLYLEKKLLGMYVSSHPLASLHADFRQFGSVSLTQIEELLAAPVNKQLGRGQREKVVFIALLSSITYRRSKKGSLMASLVFEQMGGARLEALVFEDALKRLTLPPLDTAVLVHGSIDPSFDGESHRFGLEQLRSLEVERNERLRGLVLTIEVAKCPLPPEQLVGELQRVFSADAGAIPSRIKLVFAEAQVLLDTSHYRVQVSHGLLHYLHALLQESAVVEYVLR